MSPPTGYPGTTCEPSSDPRSSACLPSMATLRTPSRPPPNWSCGRWRPSPKNGHHVTNTKSDGPAWWHACRPATRSSCSSTSSRVAILRVANMPCSERLKRHGQPSPDIRTQALLRLPLIAELICPQFVVMQVQAGNLTLAECTTVKDEVDQIVPRPMGRNPVDAQQITHLEVEAKL